MILYLFSLFLFIFSLSLLFHIVIFSLVSPSLSRSPSLSPLPVSSHFLFALSPEEEGRRPEAKSDAELQRQSVEQERFEAVIAPAVESCLCRG